MESFEKFLIEYSDEAAFARQFLSKIKDPLTMLVFADWLDDRGESELAINIRNTIENAQNQNRNLPVKSSLFFQTRSERGSECGEYLFSINDSYFKSWPDWKVFLDKYQKSHVMVEPGTTLYAVNKKDPTKWVTYTNNTNQLGRFATPRDRRPEIPSDDRFPGTFSIKIKDCTPITLMQVPDCIVIKMMWSILGAWSSPSWNLKWGDVSVIGRL